MRRAFVMVLVAAGCSPAPAPAPTHARVPTPGPAPVASSAEPPKDSDGDRIADVDDKCPFEPETYNGIDDEDGCPDKAKVVIVTSNPPAVERVRFAKGEKKPMPASVAIIDAVAEVMKAHPEVELVQIEGHTSPNEKNALELSQARADAIRAAVIAHGVDGKRLRAKGFGAHCPVAIAAEDNSRVEFKVVTKDGKPSGTDLGCPAATAAGVVSDP